MDARTIVLVVAGFLLLMWLWGLIKRVGSLLLHLLLGAVILLMIYYVLSGQPPSL